MAAKEKSYTPVELVEMLRQRRGSMTLAEFAADIGISVQLLSQILLGGGTFTERRRSVGNDKVLEYLSPKGFTLEKRDCYFLVKKAQ